MQDRKKATVADLCLMAGIFSLALLLFVFPLLAGQGSYAELVFAETGEVRRLSLTEDASYEVRSGEVHLTVTVCGGAVKVASSDCRDGICRNTPAISRAGQSIVCAPAGIVIRVVGEEAIVDGVSG